VKKFFPRKVGKYGRVAAMGLKLRRIFVVIAQLMYTLSRVKGAYRPRGRGAVASSGRSGGIWEYTLNAHYHHRVLGSDLTKRDFLTDA
jgi:hypothetical protein